MPKSEQSSSKNDRFLQFRNQLNLIDWSEAETPFDKPEYFIFQLIA